MLFNKKLNNYKNTEKKRVLLQEKAKDMDMEVEFLKTWFESIQTRFGKLMMTKSGDAACQHTERDQWILAKFLHAHIVRLRSRQAGGLKARLGALTASESHPPQDRSEDEEKEDGDGHSQSVPPVSPVVKVAKSSGTGKGQAVMSLKSSHVAAIATLE